MLNVKAERQKNVKPHINFYDRSSLDKENLGVCASHKNFNNLSILLKNLR